MTKEAPGSSLRARTLRGSVWTLIATGVQAPVALATTIVLARVLAPTSYGRLALLTFVLTLVQALSSLGLMTNFIRQVSRAHGAGDRSAERTLLRMSLTVATVQMSLVLVTATFLIHSWLPLVLIGAYACAVAATTPPAIYLTSTNRGAVIAQTAMVSTLVSAAATITVAAGTHRPDLVVATSLLASYLPHLALIPLASARGSVGLGWARVRVSRGEWRFSLMSLANAQITTLIFSQSETVFFRPSQAGERGRFAATATVGARATLLIDSLFSSVAPALVTLEGRDPTQMRRGVEALFRISSAVFILLFPAAIVAATIATPYVFPMAFGDLRWWVLPMIVISLLQTAAQPALSTWTALGSAGPPLVAGIIGAVVDVLLSATLVPTLGLRGAVVASVVSGATYLLVLSVAFRGVVSPEIYRRFLLSTGASAVLGAGADGVAIATSGPHSLLVLLALPAAVGASFAILATVRPLHPADVDLIHHPGVSGSRSHLSKAATMLLRPGIGRR